MPSHELAWSDPARGTSLFDVDLINVDTKSTFNQNGAESIIDFTLGSPSRISISNWRVDDAYPSSRKWLINSMWRVTCVLIPEIIIAFILRNVMGTPQ